MNLMVSILLLALFATGCQQRTPSPDESTTQKIEQPRANSPKTVQSAKVAQIPSDVAYSIISENVVPGIKRTLVVRLNKEISHDVLGTIGYEIKKADKNSYKRTFIFYYLPGMQVNATAWATTHFNPNLEVKIFGLTPEEKTFLLSAPTDSARDVVGQWFDDRPLINRRIIIYHKNGKVFMELVYKDGSIGTEELMEGKTSSGIRFEAKKGSDFGDYYLLNRNGDLEIRDAEGLIYTAKKI